MPIIGHVESKSIRGRVAYAAIIIALTLGGLCTVYPFAIMVSGSLRSEMDSADLDLVPDYLVDDAALYRKFLETKYNQSTTLLARAHVQSYFSFRSPPAPDGAVSDADVAKLRDYLESEDLPLHWQTLGGIVGVRTVPENLRKLRRRLDRQYDGDLSAVSRAMGVPLPTWYSIRMTSPDWVVRRYDYQPSVMYDTYFQMLREADAAERVPVSLTGLFLERMIAPRYGSTVAGYNDTHVVQLDQLEDFRLSNRVPGVDQPTLREEWLEFVYKELSPSFVRIDGATQAEYDAARQAVDGAEGYALPDGRSWLAGDERMAYAQFIESVAPERLRLVGPEYELEALFPPAVLPRLEFAYVQSHSGALRWQYVKRNYITVFDEMWSQGSVLVNTVVYCTLTIVLALLINPLAAYAMSRFKLPGTYRVLLILLATISFPPMVTMIPQFIMLRKLDLLNTFVALVVPLVANGYMIFLLKGFFDSLPQELYESARIDGAGEMRLFFQFTMALSKPILAVLALSTFTAAYTAFLYPLLVAPDQEMWLISVWLFQFQQRMDSPAVYASVLVASIPTLTIFLFAQRTIMRGIVVPTEK